MPEDSKTTCHAQHWYAFQVPFQQTISPWYYAIRTPSEIVYSAYDRCSWKAGRQRLVYYEDKIADNDLDSM